MAEQIVWKVDFSDGSHCFYGHRGLAEAAARTTGKVSEVRIKHADLSVVECQRQTDRSANVESVAHRLALELECILLSCTDTCATAKWWDSANEALAQWRGLTEDDQPHVSPLGMD